MQPQSKQVSEVSNCECPCCAEILERLVKEIIILLTPDPRTNSIPDIIRKYMRVYPTVDVSSIYEYCGHKYSRASIRQAIWRMKEEKELHKLSYGVYSR